MSTLSGEDSFAYFAYRPLAGAMGILGVRGTYEDDRLNTVVGHEQLFFEDGGDRGNVGFFDTSEVLTESIVSPYLDPHDSGWNDCVMRKAVDTVARRKYKYNLLGKPGSIDKFNCQDWADAARSEYRAIINLPKVIHECCPTAAERLK